MKKRSKKSKQKPSIVRMLGAKKLNRNSRSRSPVIAAGDPERGTLDKNPSRDQECFPATRAPLTRVFYYPDERQLHQLSIPPASSWNVDFWNANTLPAPAEFPNNDKWERLSEMESVIGYRFQNRALLSEALSHPSVPDDESFERLEFVGDAVLSLAFSKFFYLTNPEAGPGRLSHLRDANICTENLARVAVRNGFYRFMRHNPLPHVDQQVHEFTEAFRVQCERKRRGLPLGGIPVKAPKVLADIVESIAAAVYVDCDFNLHKLWQVFRPLLEPIVTEVCLGQQPLTNLLEHYNKQGKSVDVKHWNDIGITSKNVFLNGNLQGVGLSEKKEISKLNGVIDALQNRSQEKSVNACEDQVDSHALEEVEKNNINSFKGKLHDLCLRKHWPKPIYKLEEECGPGHNKQFLCSVRVVISDVLLSATSEFMPRLKQAEISAAAKLLSMIGNIANM